MKKFWRTIAGKSTLYIFAVLSVLILAVTIVGIQQFREEGFFYRTEEHVLESYLNSKVRSLAMELEWRLNEHHLDEGLYNRYQDSYCGNMEFVFYEDGKYKIWTDEKFCNYDSDYKWEYSEELNTGTHKYLLKVNIDKSFPVNDSLKTEYNLYKLAYSFRYSIFLVAFVSLICFMVCVIGLCLVSAKRPGTEELFPGALNRVPTDVLMILPLLIFFTIAYLIFDGEDDATILATLGMSVLLIPGYTLSFAARIKQKNLIKNTVVYRVFAFIGYIIKNLPLIWKVAVVIGAICLTEFFCLFDHGSLALCVALEKLLFVIPVGLYVAILLRKLQRQGEKLAEGDFDSKIDTKGFFFEFKNHAVALNSIADGMNKAVNEKVKSERMKTELITNVSHDIKTPLTSIINYCTLIEGEKTDNEKINEYTEVVVRQSNKLKKLIENLVEASKASTGSLECELVESDAAMFLSQVDGEYEDKIKSAELTLVTKVPDESIKIMADGKHMWRVFDNVMNNICKYSKEGTRVFLTLEEKDSNAVFTLKNVSRNPLDISEEELMERFVRGDSSRNTEGNGLGLSIARSLTELQNGTFDIDIDGDYFKAILRFPIVK